MDQGLEYLGELAVRLSSLHERDLPRGGIAFPPHSRRATGFISSRALSLKTLPYQLHTLGFIAFDIFANVPVCHPLGNHGESRIWRIVPATDTDESQDVRVVQRLP